MKRIFALKNVCLSIEEGDSVAIVGASGSGKSTLILVMCGIRTPSTGLVLWRGNPVGTLEE
jgi:ABC-type lipoprotein export system ATPase subunit